MLNNNKNLTVGLVVFIAVFAVVAFLMKGMPSTAPQTTETAILATPDIGAPPQPESVPNMPATETAAVPAPVTAETTPAETTPAAPDKEAPLPVPGVTAPAVPSETTAAPENAKNEDTLLSPPKSLLVDVPALMADRVIGRDSAPVTIIEYASMTCPHCAHFAMDILPQVKAKLLDTGKAKLIFRDFPLDKFALKATKMSRCAPKDKYFDLVEVIFRNQDRWTKSDDPIKSLMQLGTLAGMSDDLMKSCMEDPELEAAIMASVQDAQTKFELKATPSFVFNFGAETFSGARDVAAFEETVNKLSAGK